MPFLLKAEETVEIECLGRYAADLEKEIEEFGSLAEANLSFASFCHLVSSLRLAQIHG